MRLTLLLLFALLVGNVSAQTEYETNWSAPQKIPRGNNTPMYNLGVMDGNYYLSFVNGKSNTIHRYNLDHKYIGKQELVIQKDKKNIAIREVLHTKAGYFGYSGYYNAKESSYSLIAYDMKDGRFKNRRKIFDQPLKLSGLRSASGGKFSLFGNRASSQSGVPNSDFVMSADSSKLAFHNLLTDRNYFAEDQIMVGLFDKDLNLLWKKKQPLNYQDRDLSIIQATVSVKGEIFVLARLFERRRTKDRKLPRYDYKVFHITKDNFKEYDVELNRDNAPADAGLFIPPEENAVVVGGLYTNAERRGGLLGSFLFRIDLANGQVEDRVFKFSPRDLEVVLNKNRIRKGKGLPEYHYNIKDFINFSNGSMAMVTEATWAVTTSTPNPNGGFNRTVTYYSDDLLMPTFTADGQLEKVGVIDKYFSSGSSINQSYGIGWDEGKVYLLYNDRKTGKERKEIGMKGTSNYTDMTVFSAFGEQLYQGTLFNNRSIKSTFAPRYTSCREGQLMVLSFRAGKYLVGLIDLD